MKFGWMRKYVALLVTAALLLTALPVRAEGDQRPLIGVAWRSNQQSVSFVAVCEAIEAAGGEPVLLPMVLSADLSYADGALTDAKNPDGSLSGAAAKLVRCNTWQGSNAPAVMEGIGAIVFPGGEDISPSLYYDPQPVQVLEGFSAERDVSDYLLMCYCLEQDIPILAICRGMQMLSVVSGAEMIQDIPSAFESLGLAYSYDHRYSPDTPEAERDFVFHDVTVTARDSLLYRITGEDVIQNAPSWHHQAVISVEGTRLTVTGAAETSGVAMIEAVERQDKTFALGIQFHSEIAVVRGLDDTSIRFFTALMEAAKKYSNNEEEKHHENHQLQPVDRHQGSGVRHPAL